MRAISVHLILISFILVIETSGTRHYSMLTEFKSEVIGRESEKYLFWSICILFVAITRHLLKVYEIHIPHSILCVLFGILWGIGALYIHWLHDMAKVAQTKDIVANLGLVYFPLLIFSSAYTLDIHTFYKAFVQILIVALPAVFISASVVGMMVNLVSDTTNWGLSESLMFGIVTSIIYPTDVASWLKESSVQMKYIVVMLHGESMLGILIAEYVVNFLMLYTLGWLFHWYQFTNGCLRIFVLGIPVGYFFGFIGVLGTKFSYNNYGLLISLTFILCYTSNFFGNWIATSGLLSTMITGIMMNKERSSLTLEAQHVLESTWSLIMYIINGIVYITVGIRAPSMLYDGVPFKEFIIVLVTYLASNIARFLGYFFVMPLLSHTGYGMSFKNLIICVWCGLKSPMPLVMIIQRPVIFVENGLKHKQFFLEILGLYLLVQCINGVFVPTLLRALGMSEISAARRANMNNCMKHIYDARARAIAILKMDRFLSDANWPLVLNSTVLRHPYKKVYLVDEEIEPDEEEEFFLGYNFTFCPDCHKHIPNEPTPKEMREMLKEAKIRVLKLVKTIYSRRYENGLLSREGLRTLHNAVEIALDSKDAIIELDGLFQLFAKEGYIYRHLHTYLQQMLRSKLMDYKPPRKKFRLLCYKLMKKRILLGVMSLIVVGNFVYVGVLLIPFYTPVLPLDLRKVLGFCFFGAYAAEFVVKILGYSWASIYRHGIPTYFKSFWNNVEFVNLLLSAADCVAAAEAEDAFGDTFGFVLDIVASICLSLRILHILIRLKAFKCCRTIPQSLLKYLDKRVNRHKAQAFELGINCIAAAAEILDNLSKIIDNEKIRTKIKETTDSDRRAICEKLTTAQKERPWVASTVKTKAAIRAVLTGMEDDIYELKVSGWLDDIEYSKLCSSLSERINQITVIDLIEPPSPKVIFTEIPYISRDQRLIDFLWAHIATRKYDPGWVVIREGELSMGIYFIITGSFLVDYTPSERVRQKLKETGAIPIVDYITAHSFTTFEEKVCDYFGPGNTVGELCTLTERSYDAKVIAQSYSEALFISSRVLKQAFEMDQDPLNGLLCRIWKNIAVRMSVNILAKVLVYRAYTREKICLLVERGFVPELSNYKTFVVNEMIQDIILIEGIVVDFNTREVYTAPCHVPRTVQKLILPRSSAINVRITIETKLMVIPAKVFNEYQIMFMVEEASDRVSETEKLKAVIKSPKLALKL